MNETNTNKNNKLHFGNNLDILRNMDDECIDLICTDPPFHSAQGIYDILTTSLATNKRSTDIWTGNDTIQDIRKDIEDTTENFSIYPALNDCLYGFDQMLGNTEPALNAFLKFMGPRLVEMHRILAETGSIYIHCDPTISHYLKCMMDAIFGIENFRNEIVWHYQKWAPPLNHFLKMHDIILFYTKTDKYVFNKSLPAYAKEMLIEELIHGSMDEKPIRPKTDKGDPTKGQIIKEDALRRDVWDDINLLSVSSKERLGYPTQKPRLLYERMIKTSSNEGDLVLDPFCGSGTTLDAAQALKRHWIGTDISILAMDLIKSHLKDQYGLEPYDDYDVEGYPTGLQDMLNLVNNMPDNEFSHWAITRPGLIPAQHVEGGIQTPLWKLNDPIREDVRIVADANAGTPNQDLVHAFQKLIEDDKADMGIFITTENVPSEICGIVEDMDRFEYKGLTFPRLQFWQITDEYFENPDSIYDNLQLPGKLRVKNTEEKERFLTVNTLDSDLDPE